MANPISRVMGAARLLTFVGSGNNTPEAVIERAQAAIDAGYERRRVLIERRSAALIPARFSDPLNFAAARAFDVEIAEIEHDIADNYEAIEEAQRRGAGLSANRGRQEHDAKLERIRLAASKRLEAARRADKLAELFAKAVNDLRAASSELYGGLIVRDANAPDASFAGGPKAEAQLRMALRARGLSWASPAPAYSVLTPPDVGALVEDWNRSILDMQPQDPPPTPAARQKEVA